MEHMQAVREVNVNNTQQDQGILPCVEQEYLFPTLSCTMDIGPPLILQNLIYTIDNENRVIFQGHRIEFKVHEDNT